ncbi:hypothetical protein KY345_03715 [Candidatus Woesearchaeota archaeon]|nr:hypothetical protein [Candidatus Woesearchaeota archaeon]
MNSSNKTIDEMVDYILKNGGPDLRRRAHPKKGAVYYSDLSEALRRIHSKGRLLGVKAYHFKKVINIWYKYPHYNKELGNDMFDELMKEMLEENNNNLIDVLRDYSKDTMKRKLALETYNGVITYDLTSMIHNVSFDDEHRGSPYQALKYWIEHNKDRRLRKEYAGLKPWHLPRVSRDIWLGEQGKRNGRELTDELIRKLAKRHGSIRNALRRITAENFEKEELEFRASGCVLSYTANSMFQRVTYYGKQKRSLYNAIRYWMNTHEDKTARKRYKEELMMIKKRSERYRP